MTKRSTSAGWGIAVGVKLLFWVALLLTYNDWSLIIITYLRTLQLNSIVIGLLRNYSKNNTTLRRYVICM